MANDQYEVIALIPNGSDFSLDAAVTYFGLRSFRKRQVVSEHVPAGGPDEPGGFRVQYGEWSIVSWLDESPGVLTDSQELANEKPLPAGAEVVAGCTRRLSVYSDADPTGDHSDEITDFTDALRNRFSLLIHDPVNGGWWT